MANKTISTLAVGSSAYLNVGGVKKEFLVVHQGKPSSLYDASCDGTWLLMKDIYENRQWHSSNVNKLESSTIHSYLNNTFLNLFDSNIQKAIKQVKLPYRKNGGSGGTDQSGANGLSCKVFLLSGYEVGWTSSDNQYFPQDGAKLSYFESGTGTFANIKRIANLNGSASHFIPRPADKRPALLDTVHRAVDEAFPALHFVGRAIDECFVRGEVGYNYVSAVVHEGSGREDESGTDKADEQFQHQRKRLDGMRYAKKTSACHSGANADRGTERHPGGE